MALLSYASLNLPEAEPLDLIEAAAKAGFGAVGLCMNPPERLGAKLVRDLDERRKVKQRLSDLNMRLLDVEIFALVPDVDFTVVTPAIEAAADLGAAFILVMGNDTNEERACDNFGRYCDIAGGFGLKAILEFISFRPLRTMEQADRWLKRLNHPASGMCIDALHLVRAGETPADIQRIDAREIGYAQLCDGNSLETWQAFSEADLLREGRTNRLLPGHGVFPLTEFLDALPPDLAISVESPCEAHVHLPPEKRAALAMEATRAVLAKAKLRSVSGTG